MSLKKILSLFLLSFSLIGISNADFNDGLDAYNAGDHKTALQEWLALAEQGEVRAQYNVGWMNAYGIGTLQDYEQAVNWYRKSADQGFVHAQFNLGNMYPEVMALKRMIFLHLLGLLKLLNKEMLLLNTIWVGCMFLVKG